MILFDTAPVLFSPTVVTAGSAPAIIHYAFNRSTTALLGEISVLETAARDAQDFRLSEHLQTLLRYAGSDTGDENSRAVIEITQRNLQTHADALVRLIEGSRGRPLPKTVNISGISLKTTIDNNDRLKKLALEYALQNYGVQIAFARSAAVFVNGERSYYDDGLWISGGGYLKELTLFEGSAGFHLEIKFDGYSKRTVVEFHVPRTTPNGGHITWGPFRRPEKRSCR